MYIKYTVTVEKSKLFAWPSFMELFLATGMGSQLRKRDEWVYWEYLGALSGNEIIIVVLNPEIIIDRLINLAPALERWML